jgi:hypothetical protein
VKGALYFATGEVLTTIKGLTIRIGSAQEVGIEVPLDGTPLDNPKYPVKLDVSGIGPMRLGPAELGLAAPCQTAVDLAVGDVIVDAIYPGTFMVVPVGTRTANVFLTATSVVEPGPGCASLAEVMRQLDVKVLAGGKAGELVLSDANPAGSDPSSKSADFIAIIEIPASTRDVALSIGNAGFVSKPWPVELPLFLNEASSLPPLGQSITEPEN